MQWGQPVERDITEACIVAIAGWVAEGIPVPAIADLTRRTEQEIWTVIRACDMEYITPLKTWVVRIHNSAVPQQFCLTEQEAQAWADEHLPNSTKWKVEQLQLEGVEPDESDWMAAFEGLD